MLKTVTTEFLVNLHALISVLSLLPWIGVLCAVGSVWFWGGLGVFFIDFFFPRKPSKLNFAIQ